MQKSLASVVVIVLLVVISTAAQTFKVYPGATKSTAPDNKESKEAAKSLPPGTEGSVYFTSDSFEKVVAFYKGFAKEYTMPGMKKGGKLPSGQEMMSAFFIFDGAADIATSRNWAKVQRPYIGSFKMNGMTPEYSDVRDVTAIVVTQRR